MDKEKTEAIIKAMEEFYVGQTNEMYERHTFDTQDQEYVFSIILTY